MLPSILIVNTVGFLVPPLLPPGKKKFLVLWTAGLLCIGLYFFEMEK